jgi:hypothetical protein
MRRFRLACALLLSVASHAIAEQDNPSGEPLPISVSAKPSTVWTGRPVTLTGMSIATPSHSAVTLTVTAPNAKTSTVVTLQAALSGAGEFSKAYTPALAGTYRVQAMAVDGRGSAETTFQVQNPASPNASTVAAVASSVTDAINIVDAIKPQIAALPPNPAKDEVLKSIADLEQPLQELQSLTNNASTPISDLIKLSAQLQLPDTLQSEEDQLLSDLDTAEQAHQHSKEILESVSHAHTRCDDLETVVEGFKWAGVLLNFAVGTPSAAAGNFVQDLVAGLASGKVKSAGGSEATQFALGEVVQLRSVLQTTKVELDASTLVGRVNDVAGQIASQTMAKYCVEFSGPVKAHMRALFFQSGVKWWEYSFDLTARLTLHYPRDASGDTIPVKGRIEGYGNNFKLWENALTVQFPKLMSSAVVTKIVIPPVAFPATADGSLPLHYSSEGSVFSAAATPNAFFFEATGALTKERLVLTVGAARVDMSPKARVVAIPVTVLALGFVQLVSYTLPYKDAHFVFERTSDNVFDLPLSTQGSTIRAQQHFQNQRGNADAKGDYSVDITLCNPGC